MRGFVSHRLARVDLVWDVICVENEASPSKWLGKGSALGLLGDRRDVKAKNASEHNKKRTGPFRNEQRAT